MMHVYNRSAQEAEWGGSFEFKSSRPAYSSPILEGTWWGLLRNILLLQILPKTRHCVKVFLGHFLDLKTDCKVKSREHDTISDTAMCLLSLVTVCFPVRALIPGASVPWV